MNSKSFFHKKLFSSKWLFEKFCFRNVPGRKVLNSQSENLKKCHFKVSSYRKNFASESDSFFQKNSFETPIFNEKLCVKNMPFKIGTKKEKFAVFCWVNWVKTILYRCEFFIITWFLQKKWTQTLFFRKQFSSKIWIFQKFCFRSLPERKIFNSKFDILEIFHFKFSSCRKTFASESDSFFLEKFFSNFDFQWKSLVKSHAF